MDNVKEILCSAWLLERAKLFTVANYDINSVDNAKLPIVIEAGL